MILGDLQASGLVGDLSDPSAPIRGHIGGSLDARPGRCSDPGVAVHSGRDGDGLSILDLAEMARLYASRPHRPARFRGANGLSFRASSRGVRSDGGPRRKRRGHRKTITSIATDGVRERSSIAESTSTDEHLQLQLTGIWPSRPRHERKSGR